MHACRKDTIDYPGGDVDRSIGVCTDVIVRAFRNAGLDLQTKTIVDMTRSPRRYGLREGRRPNRNVEHRRVRRMIRYFQAHYRALPTTFDRKAAGRDAWLPGDVVFIDTFPDKHGPDHVGIVSDELDALGFPAIINNWTTDHKTDAMPLLARWPVTHRFRIGLRRR